MSLKLVVWFKVQVFGKLLRDMTRAGTGELEGVNEESSVEITGVKGEHAVEDILLGTLALIAGSKKSAGRIRVLTGFQTSGLCIVVMSISITFCNILKNDSPFSLNIGSPSDLTVGHVTGAEITFRSNPVGGVIG